MLVAGPIILTESAGVVQVMPKEVNLLHKRFAIAKHRDLAQNFFSILHETSYNVLEVSQSLRGRRVPAHDAGFLLGVQPPAQDLFPDAAQ